MTSQWSALADKVLAGGSITRDEARAVLGAPKDDLLALLDAAFRVRRAHWGRRVSIHVLENAKLGGFRGGRRAGGPRGLDPRARDRQARRLPGGRRFLLAVEPLSVARRRGPDEERRRPGRGGAAAVRGAGQALLHGDRD